MVDSKSRKAARELGIALIPTTRLICSYGFVNGVHLDAPAYTAT